MAMFAGIVLVAPFVIPPTVAVLAIPLRRLFPTAGRLAADATRTNAHGERRRPRSRWASALP
jgi:hypothetical protein